MKISLNYFELPWQINRDYFRLSLISNMTSLKLQLNKLADAHTQWQLTDSESRKRASFLYDPKVASTLDRETIYCLGRTNFYA